MFVVPAAITTGVILLLLIPDELQNAHKTSPNISILQMHTPNSIELHITNEPSKTESGQIDDEVEPFESFEEKDSKDPSGRSVEMIDEDVEMIDDDFINKDPPILKRKSLIIIEGDHDDDHNGANRIEENLRRSGHGTPIKHRFGRRKSIAGTDEGGQVGKDMIDVLLSKKHNTHSKKSADVREDLVEALADTRHGEDDDHQRIKLVKHGNHHKHLNPYDVVNEAHLAAPSLSFREKVAALLSGHYKGLDKNHEGHTDIVTSKRDPITNAEDFFTEALDSDDDVSTKPINRRQQHEDHIESSDESSRNSPPHRRVVDLHASGHQIHTPINKNHDSHLIHKKDPIGHVGSDKRANNIPIKAPDSDENVSIKIDDARKDDGGKRSEDQQPIKKHQQDRNLIKSSEDFLSKPQPHSGVFDLHAFGHHKPMHKNHDSHLIRKEGPTGHVGSDKRANNIRIEAPDSDEDVSTKIDDAIKNDGSMRSEDQQPIKKRQQGTNLIESSEDSLSKSQPHPRVVDLHASGHHKPLHKNHDSHLIRIKGLTGHVGSDKKANNIPIEAPDSDEDVSTKIDDAFKDDGGKRGEDQHVKRQQQDDDLFENSEYYLSKMSSQPFHRRIVDLHASGHHNSHIDQLVSDKKANDFPIEASDSDEDVSTKIDNRYKADHIGSSTERRTSSSTSVDDAQEGKRRQQDSDLSKSSEDFLSDEHHPVMIQHNPTLFALEKNNPLESSMSLSIESKAQDVIKHIDIYDNNCTPVIDVNEDNIDGKKYRKLEENPKNVIHHLFEPNSDEDDDGCIEEQCSSSAAVLMANVDKTIDPCENFYDFACGRYTELNPLSDNEPIIAEALKTKKMLSDNLESIFAEPKQKFEPEYIRKMKDYYAACINDDLGESSVHQLHALISYLGGWPLLVGDDTHNHWNSVFFKSHKHGVNNFHFFHFFHFDSIYVNSTKYLYMMPPDFIFNKPIHEERKNNIFKAYYDYVQDVVKLLQGQQQDNTSNGIINMINFEKGLAEMVIESTNLTESDNVFTIDELETKYDIFSWKNYFALVFNISDSTTKIAIAHPRYFYYLNALIQTTPSSTIIDYLIWKSLSATFPFQNNDIRHIEDKFNAQLGLPRRKHLQRSAECLDIIQDKMPLALSAAYVKRFFDAGAKEEAVKLVDAIIAELKKLIDGIQWITTEKIAAYNKINSMVKNVAYQEEILNDDNLDSFYKNWEVSPSSKFLPLSLLLEKFNTDNKITFLMYEDDWMSYAGSAYTKAYYDVKINALEFPASVFQGLFFDKRRLKYANYGTIGSIIGQEVIHAVDKIGSRFEYNGEHRKWWTGWAELDYVNKSSCLIDQYNDIAQLNSEESDGELRTPQLFTDYAGYKMAYNAYLDYVNKNGEEPVLTPSYSNRQLFWLGSTSIWCVNSRRVDEDHRHRVNWPLMNLPDFSHDFNCPVGSAMNPYLKCTPW